jgi:hypothetical protein
VIALLQRAFDKWNDLLSYCPECGGETEDTNHDYLDGYTLCEYEIKCKDCNASVGYWAYGNFDGPTTKTEAVHFKYLDLKYKIVRFLDSHEA